MKVLRLIHLTAAQAILDWQLAHVHPLCPDLLSMVLRQRDLADARRRLFA